MQSRERTTASREPFPRRAPQEQATAGAHEDVSRIIQGIATGVGFLGAGTILKLSDPVEIRGITTASSIWPAAALGTASGRRLYPLALVEAVVSLLLLVVLRPVEKRFWSTPSAGCHALAAVS